MPKKTRQKTALENQLCIFWRETAFINDFHMSIYVVQLSLF